MIMLCKECSEELGYWNVKLLKDLDFSRKGLYCSHCYPVALQQLQKFRFIEEYKGHKIYCMVSPLT